MPIHPIPDAPRTIRWGNAYLIPVLKPLLAKKYFINTDVLAKGMIEAALKGDSGKIEGWAGKGEVGNQGVFDNEEIKKLAKM